ncbi:MAG TPA: M56 family metallopeptidase [Caulobacteraceae bacterium]|nr:M56 family metallopeptidase [Caulobacteraceae bacterium]
MSAELLLALARCNIAAGAAILAVLSLRQPLRRWFGAERAYAAWLIVPLAALGSVMPAQLAAGAAGPLEATNNHLLAWIAAGGHGRALVLLWLGGALGGIAVAAWRHRRFAAAIRTGRAGPAAVGVIQPRLVTPADFAQRFSDDERRLVRAHELAHIDRLDARYNAAAALATWVCWFNPLLHLGVRAMRLDQELACDATVLGRLPAARRLYAETLLRTHPAAAPALGCQWRSAAHPLEARIGMLASPLPSQARRDLGLAILIAGSAAAFGTAWAMQPPAREPPMVILVDLMAPSQADATLAVAVYQVVDESRGPTARAPPGSVAEAGTARSRSARAL